MSESQPESPGRHAAPDDDPNSDPPSRAGDHGGDHRADVPPEDDLDSPGTRQQDEAEEKSAVGDQGA